MLRSQLRQLVKEIVKLAIESPDRIDTNDGSVWYDDSDSVEAVILLGRLDDKETYFSYFPKKKTVLCPYPEINDLIDTKIKLFFNIQSGNAVAHLYVRKLVNLALQASPINWEEDASARLFEIKNKYVLTFWEETIVLRPYMPVIDQFLKDFHYNPNNVLFQPSGYDSDELQTYKEFKDGSPPIRKKLLEGLMQPRMFWMNPSGEFIKVGMYEHDPWAEDFLTKRNEMPADGDLFGKMAELGWYRVVHFNHFGTESLEYDFPKTRPPSQKQLKTLKDYAIENQAELMPRAF